MTTDRFDAWSFLRDVLRRGAAIDHDCTARGEGYEMFSARLDNATRELADQLRPQLAARPDDDAELVTEEWLAAEGWSHHAGHSYLEERWEHPCGLWLWNFNDDHWICSQFDGGPGSVRVKFRTRGDVRHLLAALAGLA